MLYLLPFAPLNSGSLLRSPRVQEGDVAGIDAAFHRLQPVGLLQRFDMKLWLGRHHGEFPFRQRRLLLRRAHVGPQHAAALDQRIGLQLDLLAEAAFRRLRRHLDALAGDVVFPAVIGAAQAVVLRCGRTTARRRGGRRTRRSARSCPCVSRKASSRSPSSFTRTGGQSFSGSSSASSAGIQDSRNSWPIGVPGPVWHRRSFCSFRSIARSQWFAAGMGRAAELSKPYLPASPRSLISAVHCLSSSRYMRSVAAPSSGSGSKPLCRNFC